jgi:hypothetical protein
MEAAVGFAVHLRGCGVIVRFLELAEALMAILARLLVAAGWIVGGFPDPDGTGGSMFLAGIVLGGMRAIMLVLGAAARRQPYRRH